MLFEVVSLVAGKSLDDCKSCVFQTHAGVLFLVVVVFYVVYVVLFLVVVGYCLVLVLSLVAVGAWWKNHRGHTIVCVGAGWERW